MKHTWIPLLITAMAISGCGKKNNDAAAAPPAMPVSAILAKATLQPIKDSVQIVGTLAARDMVTVISELDSTVTNVAVTEGQQLQKGDPLFLLDDVETRARLSEAEAAHRLAALSNMRNEDLLKNQTISQQSYDEGEANLKSKEALLDLAKDSQAKTIITAPFSGTAGERAVSAGQFVTRGQALLDLVRVDPLDIVGDVPERYTAALSNGLEVAFTTDAYPGQSFTASIWYVAPMLNTASRTVRIKAEVPNAEGLLKSGMFGNMSITLKERGQSLLIPESCIQMQESSKIIVRVNTAGQAELVPVQTGIRSKGLVEILSGLNDGDRVVVEGWQKMGPGSPVIAAPESEAYGVTPGPTAEVEHDAL
jgi:membrane fusion protein (multidrug efflux system)